MQNIRCHYLPSWAKKSREDAPIWQKRKRFSIKTMHACTPLLLNVEIARIEVRIVAAPTIFAGFSPQWLVPPQVRNHKRPNFGPVVANMLPRLGRQCCAITEMISEGCTWPPSLALRWLPVLVRNRHMLMAHYWNDIHIGGLYLAAFIWPSLAANIVPKLHKNNGPKMGVKLVVFKIFWDVIYEKWILG